MRDLLIQQIGFTWIIIIAGAIAAVGVLLLMTHRTRRKRLVPKGPASQKVLTATSASVAHLIPQSPLGDLDHLDRRVLEGRLSTALRKGQAAELPKLYLALANRSLGDVQQSEAEDLLRKAILGAAAVDQKDIHASARVTLGDLAHGAGDLTTACEHWQIARGLYLELDQSSQREAVESRMHRNGCPTDWVLTEF